MTTDQDRTKSNNKKITNKERTMKIILAGLMMAMIVVATMLIVIPTPFTNGYIHLGDAMIFLSVLILGWKRGAVAAGVGSALADLLLGYAVWVPWTLVIKGVMGAVMGLFILRAMQKPGKNILGVPVYQLLGMILAGFFMAAGYFIAGGVIYGNFVTAAMGIPWNIVQFSVGVVIASILAAALYKTPTKQFFTYRPMTGTNTDTV
ncbi:MAG TPA: ECF transporter S component [Anaerovoracaceae bacterium]|nr:ECF transporter S component [Anaerovoracaceae bacterium]